MQLLNVGAAAILSLVFLAQTHPDFSGVWMLDAEKSATAGGGTGGTRGAGDGTGGGVGLGPPPQQLSIKQDAQKLRVEQRGDRGTSTVVYDLAGKAEINQMPVGGGGNSMPASFRSKWEGAALVTAISVQVPMQSAGGRAGGGGGRGLGGGRGFAPSLEIREVRFLTPDGTMIVETSAPGRGGARATVYRKANP
jgi:hypothetical protein